MMTSIRKIEIVGMLFGLAGNLLLATRGAYAGYGFVAYLVSNVGWLFFSFKHRHWFMFTQFVGFTITSIYGVWEWLL